MVWIPTFRLTLRHLVVKVTIHIQILFIFSTPVLIRYLWQLKTVVSMQCLMHAVLLTNGNSIADKQTTNDSKSEVLNTVAACIKSKSSKNSFVSKRTAYFKNANIGLDTNIYAYFETSGGQSYNLYLNVVLN